MTFSALDSAIFGPLFATEEMRAAFSDRALVVAMLAAETALARVQARFGISPEALAHAIGRIRAEEFDLDALGADTARVGVPVIPFVKALAAALPPDLEPWLHRGATTQDVLDTAFALRMRAAFEYVARDLGALMLALEDMAERHRHTPCAGRTYGQHAAPITFGFKVAVWIAGLSDVAERLPEAAARACRASLGGPVGTLAALGDDGPAIATAFADELGLAAAPIAWHTRRDGVREAGTTLAALLGALGKMAGDVASLTATEIAEVAEPHASGRGGSSAMPHKRNPVSATTIVAAASAARGLCLPLFAALEAAHERPAGAWHAEWLTLPQLFGLASGALREGLALARGLVVDEQRMRANLDLTRGLLFSEAASAALAGTLGRAAAQARVAAAADAVRSGAASLQDALADVPGADRAALAHAFDLEPHVAAAAAWIGPALDQSRTARAALAVLAKE